MENNNHSTDKQKPSLITSALSEHGVPPWLVYVLGGIGLVYILNPTAGIIELLPDNLPILGNLDEAGAAMLVWAGIVEIFEARRRRMNQSDSSEKTQD
jgi:uncharacterized membrane protein YkvA (DUF1232 family)